MTRFTGILKMGKRGPKRPSARAEQQQQAVPSQIEALNAKRRTLRQTLKQADELARRLDPSGAGRTAGDAHRELMARRSREKTAAVADIGDIPPVKHPQRRKRAEHDLHYFLRTYFPQSTGLRPFSIDHIRIIGRLEKCIIDGGYFAEAMFRGSAKTSIAEGAIIWGALFGHRQFMPIFGADATAADSNIDSIKTELEDNDLLYEDFPEVCHAVRAMEGKVQRCRSQTYKGKLTHIEWTANTIVLPIIDGSKASGAIITAHGIAGASRGMKHKLPDGTQQRPDFVFLDDLQTDESAGSPLQVAKRLKIVRKNILRLGSHGRRLACFAALTIIEPNDLADQLTNPSLNSAWQSERVPFLKKHADDYEKNWLQTYAKIRRDWSPDAADDQKRAHHDATELYRRNREQWDAGAVVTWEHAYDPDAELSALQHAYNVLIDDGAEVFAAEFQCAPINMLDMVASFRMASAGEIARRVNRVQRGVVPAECELLTCYIDVQQDVLFWVVCGWNRDFSGRVIDYGAYPEQPMRGYWSLQDVRLTLRKDTGSASIEGGITEGLGKLATKIIGREWMREDGAALRIRQCLVDSRFKKKAVFAWARRTPYAATVMPAMGIGLGPTNKPIEEYRRRRGEKIGENWQITRSGSDRTQYVLIDTNSWKTFTHERLIIAPSDPGALTLFGDEPMLHAMYADHLVAESCTQTEGRGRIVNVWRIKPGRPDNHWLDCTVGCAVAASMLGISTVGDQPMAKRKRVRLSDLQRQKMVGR